MEKKWKKWEISMKTDNERTFACKDFSKTIDARIECRYMCMCM